MSDAHDPNPEWTTEELRAVAQADAAEAVTEAENRDQVNWSMHVQAHEANYQQGIAAAAYGFQQAAVKGRIAVTIGIINVALAATAVKGILRGWKRVL